MDTSKDFARAENLFAWAFLLPVFLLIFSGGNIQMLPVGYVIASTIFITSTSHDLIKSSQVRRNIRWVGYLIIALFGGALLSIGFSPNDISIGSFYESMLRLVLFSFFLLTWAKFIDRGLQPLADKFIAPAIICLAGIFIQMTFAPDIVNGRHTFLGTHPNLGGEIVVFLLFFLLFSSSTLLRIMYFGISLYILFLLQSRAALIAAIVLFFAAEAFLHRRGFIGLSSSNFIISLGLTIFATSISVLFFQGILIEFVQWVADRVLLLNDSYRGLGTGLVGRLSTYESFTQILAENPLIGVGYDQLRWQGFDSEESGVHNGFVVLLTELGIFGLIIIGLMIHRLIADRHDRFLLLARIAFGFMFFLSARSINLGVFPVIFWVLMMPWPPTSAFLEKTKKKEKIKSIKAFT